MRFSSIHCLRTSSSCGKGRDTLKILLDSHTFVWFVSGNPRCSARAKAAIEVTTAVYVSAVTAWELATKVRLGKWPEAEPFVRHFADVINAFDFLSLPITLEEGRLAGMLLNEHKDPFDRILTAQAQLGDMMIATADRAFEWLGSRVIW